MLAGLGETKRVGLIASDKAGQAFAGIVPFPNRDGRRLQSGGEHYVKCGNNGLLSVAGFKPNAPLEIESRSEGEKQQHCGTQIAGTGPMTG